MNMTALADVQRFLGVHVFIQRRSDLGCQQTCMERSVQPKCEDLTTNPAHLYPFMHIPLLLAWRQGEHLIEHHKLKLELSKPMMLLQLAASIGIIC